MTLLSGLIRKQGQILLENERYAMLHAVILALLPYTAWLSVAVVALVTLRKGWTKGALVLIPALGAYFVLAYSSTALIIALLNASLVFMPAYLAAGVLRMSVNWRFVIGSFFVQALVVVVLLQLFMPNFIAAQLVYVQAALRELQGDSALMELINNKAGMNQMVLASYLLGLQIVGVVFSACLSLMLARSVQSQLFCPGGFRREMLTFRADKIEFVFLVILFIGAIQQNVIAMSLLPILIFYFMLAGFSLSFNVLAKQKPLSLMIVSIASLVLLPFVMLPVYVIFGSLDSLFNFRLYLLADAGNTI